MQKACHVMTSPFVELPVSMNCASQVHILSDMMLMPASGTHTQHRDSHPAQATTRYISHLNCNPAPLMKQQQRSTTGQERGKKAKHHHWQLHWVTLLDVAFVEVLKFCQVGVRCLDQVPSLEKLLPEGLVWHRLVRIISEQSVPVI